MDSMSYIEANYNLHCAHCFSQGNHFFKILFQGSRIWLLYRNFYKCLYNWPTNPRKNDANNAGPKTKRSAE